MSFFDKVQEVDKNYDMGGGGEKFKIKEGDNRIRVLAEPIFYESVALDEVGKKTDKVKAQWLTYVYDYADKQIKVWFMPVWAARWIGGLEQDEDYAYDSFPMPYDLKINAKGAGTLNVEYNNNPAPKREDMPADIMDDFKQKIEKRPLSEIAEKAAAKAGAAIVKPDVTPEQAKEHNDRQAIINAAELNPAWQNIREKINAATTEAEIDELDKKIEELKSLSVFPASHAEILSSMVFNKRMDLSDSAAVQSAAAEDISVEDIPF